MQVPYEAELVAMPGGEFLVKAIQRALEELQAQPFRIGSNRIWAGQNNPDASVNTVDPVATTGTGDLYLRNGIRNFVPSDTTTRPAALYVKAQDIVPNRGWFLVTVVGPGGMTSGRIPYSDGGSVLQGSSLMSFDGTTFNATQIATNQITFPAVQAASSGVNVLDDYEEGTWTPTLTSAGGGAPAYGLQTGQYVKVGRQVVAKGEIQLTGLGTLGAGNLQVVLPFTSDTTANHNSPLCIGYFDNLAAATSWVGGYLPPNSTAVNLTWTPGAGAASVSFLALADITATLTLMFGCSYLATA